MISSLAIPSPDRSVWYLGPFPLRAYAIAILFGIAAGVWIGIVRYTRRGGPSQVVVDTSFWAVPFGIVGGRIYHVITSPDAYFGPRGNPWRAFYIWEGGMGIWGAIALGAVGAYIGIHRAGYRLAPFADAVAPGLLVAQAIGRLGNWFNQELFGRPTTLPWGLTISPDNPSFPADLPSTTLFHPTFLYEIIWNLAGAGLLVWLDRRLKLGFGRVFALYVVIYTLGRSWIEMLRIDPAEHVLGLRLNVWTCLIIGLGGLIAFFLIGRRHPGRQTELRLDWKIAADSAGAATAPSVDPAGPDDAKAADSPDAHDPGQGAHSDEPDADEADTDEMRRADSPAPLAPSGKKLDDDPASA